MDKNNEIEMQYKTCVDNIRYYDRLAWDFVFVIWGAIITSSILIMRAGMAEPRFFYQYVYVVLNVIPFFIFIAIFIHLYYDRLSRIDYAFLKFLEYSQQNDSQVPVIIKLEKGECRIENQLSRYSVGKEISNNIGYKLSGETKYSMGRILSYLFLVFTGFQIISMIMIWVMDSDAYLWKFELTFTWVMLFGIINTIIIVFFLVWLIRLFRKPKTTVEFKPQCQASQS